MLAHDDARPIQGVVAVARGQRVALGGCEQAGDRRAALRVEVVRDGVPVERAYALRRVVLVLLGGRCPHPHTLSQRRAPRSPDSDPRSKLLFQMSPMVRPRTERRCHAGLSFVGQQPQTGMIADERRAYGGPRS
ncbi:hypothetical protein D3C86_1751720 [compost metagenome]